MLVEFRVENHLSFKDLVVLSLVASGDTSLPDNRLPESPGQPRLLRSAAVYGANASGKSNLVASLAFVRNFVLSSAERRPDTPIAVSPFRLLESTRRSPSVFEVSFLLDDERWQYGFAADATRVHEEWLHHFPGNRRRTLFARKAGADSEYKWGESWTGDRQVLARRTRPNALFLSVAAQFNHGIATPIVRWFDKHLDVLPAPDFGGIFDFESRFLCRDQPEMRERVASLLGHADVGITGIQVRLRPLSESSVLREFPDEMRKQVFEGSSIMPEFPDISTMRRGQDADGNEVDVEFRLDEESAGTRRFFGLAAPLLSALQDGTCLVADELDSRLHPLLTRRIVEMFNDPATNPKGAQLLFTTHDVNLLDQHALLRRDQVIFTNRTAGGCTEVYSLWDFKAPRKEANLRKDYLLGRYGAIPFIERLLEG